MPKKELYPKMNIRNPEEEVPKVHEARWHRYPHSDRVLVLVEGSFKAQESWRFATYIKYPKHFNESGWIIEGCTGNWTVLAWAYLKKLNKIPWLDPS